MKYFSLDRIREAITHLSNFHSTWVVVPLVLASNGVNKKAETEVEANPFLERYFSGSLMGLPAFLNKNNVLRPRFSELKPAGKGDYVLHQQADLWGSTYSSRGYREMRVNKYLSGELSAFKIESSFVGAWKANIAETFRFEELLVWLFAFKGFPEEVESWTSLFEYFQAVELAGVRFAPEFGARFKISGDVPWPAHLLNARPSDEEFQRVLLPSRSISPQKMEADLGGFVEAFVADVTNPAVGLRVERQAVLRLTAALASKRFLILGGLAGSGKTKVAQAFARWLTPAPKGGQPPAYVVVAVGADWTGSDNILGYPDGLDPKRYVSRPALELIQRAGRTESAKVPHFLILDEMNLSHVERYFADLLSLIELPDETMALYHPTTNPEGELELRMGAEPTLRVPLNLFIIGTVNVDETTYMISPKVLDRANVIEFRMSRDELGAFLAAPSSTTIDELGGLGARFGAAFSDEVCKPLTVPAIVRSQFEAESLLFFDLLSDHGAEFGFRVANEIARFLHFYQLLGGYPDDHPEWFNAAMDAAIVQKLLPKLHGSRPKLEGLLWALAWACGAERKGDTATFLAECREAGRAQEESKFGPDVVTAALGATEARYPLSLEKVMRMWKKLVRDQFVTFFEA